MKMKFDLLVNDKTTIKDELILLTIIILFLVTGAILCVLQPKIWIIEPWHTFLFGMLLIFSGIVLIPGLVYRLLSNDRSNNL